ncbi:hypothetical protein BOTBODRAFT_166837 [Botryobasidium botryosum FD-172 SS1]|uniref:NADH:flavin oxidoreductase/NADH oxidase N-terminal domain-containing protein n=1 Tax=Botryobasidium botryosum (strain FD-172 SS1) TaxID=930990 RepID=A0A067M7L4_BOTB1|nr:hypothetical protein BOTBODRAFT_166837 [Botryobasidium botryosum FD-172 SS1]
MPSTSPKLFQPLKVGEIKLQHRVVMAPLTRYRADDQHVHSDIGLEYYTQRASTPGTLLITEGTIISKEAGGYANAPGIYTEDQIAAWKKIVDSVHARGSFIYLQIMAMGRAARPEVVSDETLDFVAPSAIPLPDNENIPRPLTASDIKRYIESFGQAAHNAVFGAGFDGVEIHGANGYLVDQFIQDVSNHRTDEYGGSIENRSRFALDVIKAVTDAVGESRTAIRFSPWSSFQGMRMADPVPTYTHIVNSIRDRHPNLAYLHFIEPLEPSGLAEESNDFARQLWQPRPFFSAGLYDANSGFKVAEDKDVAIVYGRWFISNPDLPLKLKYGVPLTPFNPSTFYLRGPTMSEGYIDYPFAKDYTPSGIQVAA